MSKELKCPKCGMEIRSINDFTWDFTYMTFSAYCAECGNNLDARNNDNLYHHLNNIIDSTNHKKYKLKSNSMDIDNLSMINFINGANLQCNSKVRVSFINNNLKLCIPKDNQFYVRFDNGCLEMIPYQLTVEFNMAIPMFTKVTDVKTGDILVTDSELSFVSKTYGNALECVDADGKVTKYTPISFMGLKGFKIISSSSLGLMAFQSSNGLEDLYKLALLKKFL